MKPETLSTDNIYKGKVFDVVRSKIREDESVYEREIIIHHGSAVIVPVLKDQTVALVRQYRPAAEDFLLEIPAGTVEAGERPEDCALREVEEEIGMKAGKLEKLIEFYVSPGFLTEKMHLFLATDLTGSRQNLDEDENISIEIISLNAAFEKIRSNEIIDAKTIIGLMLAGKRMGLSY